MNIQRSIKGVLSINDGSSESAHRFHIYSIELSHKLRRDSVMMFGYERNKGKQQRECVRIQSQDKVKLNVSQ